MMHSHGVKIGLPDINKAHFGFKPDFEDRQIVFGLKGLVGIGDDAVQHLIANRPYTSFEDFYTRLHETGIIKKSQLVHLIKAGCFESFGSRVDIMKQFINKIYVPKIKLNMQNFNMIIENNLIPKEHHFYSQLFEFRKHVMKKTVKISTDTKDKFYMLDDETIPFFYDHFSNDSIVEFQKNKPVISEKIFKKEYDSKVEGIKEWLTDPKTLEIVNETLFKSEWEANSAGNISKWEMESLSFYYTEHELSHLDNKKYGIVKFNELLEEPEITGHYFSKGKERPKFKIVCIVGTVLDRDKNKHTVTLLTTDGVVTLKYYDGQFAHYNKQVSKNKGDGKKEIVEKSWFTRGNLLVVCGYRRGSQFRPYRYLDTNYKHTTMLITEVKEDGTIQVNTDRKQ